MSVVASTCAKSVKELGMDGANALRMQLYFNASLDTALVRTRLV